MAGFRSSTTSGVIAASTAILALQTTSALAASQKQRLRHRNLATESRDYERLGCFKDSKNDRILGHKMVDDKELTSESCYDYCADMGAPLFATQWSIECWCATEVEVDFGRHGDGAKCDYPCVGDESEMCGGHDAIDLYRIGPDSESDGDPDDGEGGGSENDSGDGVPERKTAPEGALVDDIVKIEEVSGANPGGAGWADSYSVGDKCYMWTTWDHDIGDVMVDTPKGRMKIRALYDLLEEGPGRTGHPLYNDIQCGNGPANTAPDEKECPGLVEHGREGCGQIGPKWDLSELE